MSKSSSEKTNHLRFPNGRTVRASRLDAKALKKNALSSGQKISTSAALDLVAEENGIVGGWHQAIRELRDNEENNRFPPYTISSVSGMTVSQTLRDIKPSICDDALISLIKKLEPAVFADSLQSQLSDAGIRKAAIVNERHQLYRTVHISTHEESYSFHLGMQKCGFYSLIHDFQSDFVPDGLDSYESVFALDQVKFFNLPNRKSRPVGLKSSLMLAMVYWLDYLDSDPPIDNNESFILLRNNRPNWVYDMCAIYWKFAYELTGQEMSPDPSKEIELLVRIATYHAYMRVNELWETRDF